MKRTSFLLLLLCLVFVPATVHALQPPTEAPPPDSAHPTLGAALTPVDVVVLLSIGDALTKADDTVISLEGKVVTGRFSESGSYFFYIEEDDRSAGIRVNSSLVVVPGDRVDISSGTLSSISGERCLNNVSASIASASNPVPAPLAMDNPTVGGATLDPATGYTPGITGAIGAFNKGLLIMAWGRVTYVDSTNGYFYVDDGTDLRDGTLNMDEIEVSGIRVRATGITWPTEQQFVVVTGLSSSFILETSIRRQIRVRGDSDIVLTSGETISCPANTLKKSDSPEYYAWSLIGLPGVPINSSPAYVFESIGPSLPGSTLVDNLWRWEPTGDQNTYPWPYVTFPSSGVVPFGCIYSGQGYWIRNDDTEGVDAEGAISYLGVMEPVQSTDRYISLPRKRLTCIGNPFDHTVLYQSVLVTDGNCVLPLMEACENGWVSPYGYWWSNWNQGLNWLEAELQWADPTQICMRPWQGYWVVSERDNVALIILHDGEESMSLVANPAVITSGGSTEITADMTLRSGAPMIAAPVNFTTTAGTLSTTTPSEGWTDDNGEIKVTLSNIPTGQLAIVTATTDYACDGPITKEVRVGESGTVAYVELTADPTSILADGVSQSTIAVHVTNSAGVGLASKTANLTKTGGGTLSDTSITTNGSGDGMVTLTSSTSAETVIVSATCQGVSDHASVEFTNSTGPSISITSPTAGQSVSDGIYISFDATDTGGQNPGIADVQLYVDDVLVGSATTSNPDLYYETFTKPNGTHQLRMSAYDVDGNTAWSPPVVVVFNNLITDLNASPIEFNPAAFESTTITATLASESDWTLTIADLLGNPVVTHQGHGTAICETWNGSGWPDDIYTATLSAQTSSGGMLFSASSQNSAAVIFPCRVPDDQVEILSVAGPNLRWWTFRIRAIANIGRAHGYKVKTLPPSLATWPRISSILTNPNCRMFYVDVHGNYSVIDADPVTHQGIYRTFFALDDGLVLSRSNNPRWHTVHSLGLTNSQKMIFVMVDGCYSGKAGSGSGYNDMAYEFGIYNTDEYWSQAYSGWVGMCEDSLDFTDYVTTVFNYFGAGYPIGGYNSALGGAFWQAYFSDWSWEWMYRLSRTYGDPDLTMFDIP